MPRISLAYALLAAGAQGGSVGSVRPAYEEVIPERRIGLLLIEPRTIVNELLEIVPADVAGRTVQHTVAR